MMIARVIDRPRMRLVTLLALAAAGCQPDPKWKVFDEVPLQPLSRDEVGLVIDRLVSTDRSPADCDQFMALNGPDHPFWLELGMDHLTACLSRSICDPHQLVDLLIWKGGARCMPHVREIWRLADSDHVREVLLPFFLFLGEETDSALLLDSSVSESIQPQVLRVVDDIGMGSKSVARAFAEVWKERQWPRPVERLKEDPYILPEPSLAAPETLFRLYCQSLQIPLESFPGRRELQESGGEIQGATGNCPSRGEWPICELLGAYPDECANVLGAIEVDALLIDIITECPVSFSGRQKLYQPIVSVGLGRNLDQASLREIAEWLVANEFHPRVAVELSIHARIDWDPTGDQSDFDHLFSISERLPAEFWSLVEKNQIQEARRYLLNEFQYSRDRRQFELCNGF